MGSGKRKYLFFDIDGTLAVERRAHNTFPSPPSSRSKSCAMRGILLPSLRAGRMRWPSTICMSWVFLTW